MTHACKRNDNSCVELCYGFQWKQGNRDQSGICERNKMK